MQLITLNIWGGHVHKPLVDFVAANTSIDIFCFQEVYHKASDKISDEDREVKLDIFSEIAELLPQHTGFFRPAVNNIYGIASFVKKDLEVIGEGEIIIHKNNSYPGKGPTHSRNLQWLEIRSENQIYSVINVHGLWNGKGKTDTEERVSQSKIINNFLSTLNTPKILCGDFNIRPDTESIKIIEKTMENLVKKFNIESTRTSYYPKPEKFADYIFVSPGINVKNFVILPHEVSDHAPLLLEFDFSKTIPK